MTIPNVSCLITDKAIDPVAARSKFAVGRHCGGYLAFEGIVRESNHGKMVTRLEYEVYYQLALSELNRIAVAAKLAFDLDTVAVVHRIGSLEIGSIAVLIQVSGKHRNECFLGCRQIIDELKVSVPIWKHEFYADGTDDWTVCSHHI